MVYRLNMNMSVQVAYCELESTTILTLHVSIKIEVHKWTLVPKKCNKSISVCEK